MQFGGKSVLVFGGLYQLPPICAKAIFIAGWVIAKNGSNRETLDKTIILTV